MAVFTSPPQFLHLKKAGDREKTLVPLIQVPWRVARQEKVVAP